MKKGSTAATMPSRNISQQKLTIGLDLGDRKCWYCPSSRRMWPLRSLFGMCDSQERCRDI
jgi:hypothetical protein